MVKYFQHKLFAPLGIFLIGLVLTVVVFQSIYLTQNQSNIEQHRYVVDRRSGAMQALINRDIDLIGSTANFYFASNSDQWHNFEQFAPYILRGSETLIALEWMEHIPADSFEERQNQVRETFPEFDPYTVVEKQVISGISSSEENRFILTDVMPRTEENLDLLGFYSSHDRWPYIVQQLLTTKEAVISDKVRILQDGTDTSVSKAGVLVYHPVFAEDGRTMKGIVIGVIRISSYISTLMETFKDHSGMSLKILDTGYESEDDALLFDDLGIDYQGASFIRSLYLPSRVWEVHFYPSTDRAFAQNASLALVVVAGILITLTLSGLFYYLNNERLIVGKLLSERTKDLETIAYQDPLTNVSNRREFDRNIAKRIEEGRVFGLLVIDLDDFKDVNDKFGHAVGDEVLIEVAKCLDSQKIEGELLARIGGDEFAFVCVASSGDELDEKAEKLCDLVRDLFPRRSTPQLDIKFSIGGALWKKGTTAIELHKIADRALYAAKRNGKNQFAISQPPEKSAIRERLYSV